MITKHEWQEVCNETEGPKDLHNHRTARMKVEGGWLYRFECTILDGTYHNSVAMEFVPDQKKKTQVRVKRRSK